MYVHTQFIITERQSIIFFFKTKYVFAKTVFLQFLCYVKNFYIFKNCDPG